jgi:hypothetical protein
MAISVVSAELAPGDGKASAIQDEAEMAASVEQADRLAQIGFGCLVSAHDDQGLADMAGQYGRV